MSGLRLDQSAGIRYVLEPDPTGQLVADRVQGHALSTITYRLCMYIEQMYSTAMSFMYVFGI